MKLQSILDQLLLFVDESSLEPIEEQNLSRDLERVLTRLRSRDYKLAHSNPNTFNVAERVQHIWKGVDSISRSGRAWQAVFSHIRLDSKQTILDLCPGHAPKVQLGLHYVGFRGEVTLVNSSIEALKLLTDFLAVFDPAFSVNLRAQDIFSLAGQSFDVIVANHILDDVLLNDFAVRVGENSEDYYSDEALLLSAWQRLDASREVLIPAVSKKFATLFQSTLAPSGTLIITQYQSYSERILGLNTALECCQELLNRLKRELCAGDFEQQDTGEIQLAEGSPFSCGEVHLLRR